MAWLLENHFMFFLEDLASDLFLEVNHCHDHMKVSIAENAYEPQKILLSPWYSYCEGLSLALGSLKGCRGLLAFVRPTWVTVGSNKGGIRQDTRRQGGQEMINTSGMTFLPRR